MATHSSVLAWRIPGTGEPGGLPSMGSHRVGHKWSDLAAAAAALCLAHIYSISGILKRDEERKGRNKGRKKAGREGEKEERKKEEREEGKREGGEGERHYEDAGNFLRRQIQASIFLNLPKHNPLLLSLLLTFLSTQALPVMLLKYIPVTLLSFSFAIL